MKNLIKELFLESVKLYPDRPALEISGQTYSYSHLNTIVDQKIKSIQKANVQGKAIIVLNEHTIDAYASLLAINFSGNTILPVETSWPKQRIENILEQAEPAAIILSENRNSALAEMDLSTNILVIDTTSGITEEKNYFHSESANYKDIAYIIFTSGTTGVPKGVPVKLESINAFISFYKDHYDFSQTDRFLQVYELTFDVAYFSFLIPICCGACCCILNERKGTPKYLFIVDDLIRRNITVVSMVPTVLHFIKKYLKSLEASSVRYSFFSGDALYHSEALVWQEFVPNAAVHNFYGPTETTIVCTKYTWEGNIASEDICNDIVALGKPFSQMAFKIVDEDNNEVDEGSIGELAFAGVQVIDAYLNGANKEKFFDVKEGGRSTRYYKTGDLASLNKHENLIFHGRADLQVKINGYRIELEEVELALRKVLDRKCIVIKKRNEHNANYLAAYVEGSEDDMEVIKKSLLQYLPDYMIPSRFEFIEQLPLSENGKIDKLYLQRI